MENDITNDTFTNCAIWAYWEAMSEGKQGDSDYVKKLAYSHYENELRNKSEQGAVA